MPTLPSFLALGHILIRLRYCGGKNWFLKQKGNLVTGVWNEGISTGSGGSGKLKGYGWAINYF